jgi:hypothetical protein
MKNDERRRHKMFVTRNREYHTRDGLVVGVRDRKTGIWVKGHGALLGSVAGALREGEEVGFVKDFTEVQPGDALCIYRGERGLVTSAVESIERPLKEIVQNYLKAEPVTMK